MLTLASGVTKQALYEELIQIYKSSEDWFLEYLEVTVFTNGVHTCDICNSKIISDKDKAKHTRKRCL